jgi:hypothetical protein
MFNGTLMAIAEALSARYGVVRPRDGATSSTHGRHMQRLNIISRELTPLDGADGDAMSDVGAQGQAWPKPRDGY